ncbi:DoxX family protein [Nocardia sp. NPDC051052]|uniref:DoxX family protein n=1 Tax=Nocardia sp. NPDC051052 TaxID=3364322 RepID=UPI0037A2080F
MTAVGVKTVEHDSPGEAAHPEWSLLTRIAFRFSFGYFVLICVGFGLPLVYAGIFGKQLPAWASQGLLYPLSPALEWVGRSVFGADVALHLDSGSGDQAIIWIFVFCILVTAVAATVGWSVLDRRRPNYQALHAWFLLFVRLCLGATMLIYGFGKLIPLQMPEPSLMNLLTPYGNFPLTGVLWLQVGSSPVYEMLLGSAEVLGGLLLFLPRTTTLGAMISVVSMAQVFVLNMTFAVPVKILSFHLLLLSLVVLAPQAKRLANVLVLQRSTDPARQPELFHARRWRRVAIAGQVALLLWVLVSIVPDDLKGWKEAGGGAPKPPLYGIWAVSEFSQDGQPVAPLTTDQNRWRRVVFDIRGMAYQQMDGRLVPVRGVVDSAAHTITVAQAAGDDVRGKRAPTPIGTFTYSQSAPDRLRLDGQLRGHQVTLSLEQVDLKSFPLRSTEFKWVQDYPHFS